MNRYVRRLLGMQPKPPPKYRIFFIMASNMPDSLDAALLRPGRLDRKYKVGYPSKEGRKRTFEGYLSRVKHQLTDGDLEQLSHISPYATGASIKDMVNEALIHAHRRRPRHDHLARHAGGEARRAARAPRRLGVHRGRAPRGRDPRGVPRGGVLPFEHEDDDRRGHDRASRRHRRLRRSRSRSKTASACGSRSARSTSWCTSRRLPASACSSPVTTPPGVGGDMGSATTIAMEMEGFHAMGQTLGSHRVTKMGIQGERGRDGHRPDVARLRVRPPHGVPARGALRPRLRAPREGPHLGALPRGTRSKPARRCPAKTSSRSSRGTRAPRSTAACTTRRRSRRSSRSTTRRAPWRTRSPTAWRSRSRFRPTWSRCTSPAATRGTSSTPNGDHEPPFFGGASRKRVEENGPTGSCSAPPPEPSDEQPSNGNAASDPN